MSEELLYNKIYEQTKDFGRTQFVREIMRLQQENQQLKENWNELKKWVEEVYNEENKYNFGTEDYAYNQVLCLMQELESKND